MQIWTVNNFTKIFIPCTDMLTEKKKTMVAISLCYWKTNLRSEVVRCKIAISFNGEEFFKLFFWSDFLQIYQNSSGLSRSPAHFQTVSSIHSYPALPWLVRRSFDRGLVTTMTSRVAWKVLLPSLGMRCPRPVVDGKPAAQQRGGVALEQMLASGRSSRKTRELRT